MAFPNSPLGTKVQLQINGTWTDVVRYDAETKLLQKNGIMISRGAGGLQQRTPAGTCTWVWQDPNGIYNNENPRSPYFGLIPRNTPVRVYVPRSEKALYIYPTLPVVGSSQGGSAGYISTPDSANVSVTGDMEVRFDIEPNRLTRYYSGRGKMWVLGGKYLASPNRTWYLRLGDPASQQNNNQLALAFSANGTTGLVAVCDGNLPVYTGRVAIKVTLDIDNGAGSREIKFFYSTTGINGTYTQLGSTITGAAIAGLADTTAPLQLGTVANGDLSTVITSSGYSYFGRIYGFQLWNGISTAGGTKVAEADFTTKAVGTTSFADGLGNTWTLAGTGVEITDADYRFYGELSAPVQVPKQSNNGQGTDITIEAEAGGIIRRLTANDTPVSSPIYLHFSQLGSNGWWTGEDSATSDSNITTSAVSGVSAATISDITFEGFDETLPGSAGVMQCGSTAPTFVGACKAASTTLETHFIGYFKFDALPAAETTVFNIYSENGTVKRWTFNVDGGGYLLRGYNSVGTEIVTKITLYGVGAEPTGWIIFHLQLTNTGGLGTIDIKSEWYGVETGAGYTQNSIGTLNYAGSNGTISRVVVQASGNALDGMRFCHLMASNQVGILFFSTDAALARASAAYPGETADERFIRICQLIGVTPVLVGERGASERMGPQPIDTGIKILYECAETDGAIITEAPDQPALEFRTRDSLYNQFGLNLSYAHLAEGLRATPDDTDIANDIILDRSRGGQARATLEFGPMSTQPPPNGINPVQDNPTVNCFDGDAQLTYLSQFRLQLGTWPTSRYPSLVINMHHPTFSSNAARFLLAQKTAISDIVTVDTLPRFMAPDVLYLLVKGIKEEIYAQEWKLIWAMVPYGPYMTSENAGGTDIYSTFKAAHTTINGVVQQQLNAGINSSTTSIAVKTLSGVLFTTGAVNYTIKVGGEFMTVTNVSGATSPQTLTVTRGVVGGYAAAHNANDPVLIFPTLKARL